MTNRLRAMIGKHGHHWCQTCDSNKVGKVGKCAVCGKKAKPKKIIREKSIPLDEIDL